MNGASKPDYSTFELTLGEHKLTVEEEAEQHFKIDQIVIHPTYNPVTTNSDIGKCRSSLEALTRVARERKSVVWRFLYSIRFFSFSS